MLPGTDSKDLDKGQGLYRISELAPSFFKAEISRLRIGGISSLELGELKDWWVFLLRDW